MFAHAWRQGNILSGDPVAHPSFPRRYALHLPAPADSLSGTPRPLAANDAPMPKRTDLQSILIPGSGPIVIGQAAEFD
jgi:hypothetical protein